MRDHIKTNSGPVEMGGAGQVKTRFFVQEFSQKEKKLLITFRLRLGMVESLGGSMSEILQTLWAFIAANLIMVGFIGMVFFTVLVLISASKDGVKKMNQNQS